MGNCGLFRAWPSYIGAVLLCGGLGSSLLCLSLTFRLRYLKPGSFFINQKTSDLNFSPLDSSESDRVIVGIRKRELFIELAMQQFSISRRMMLQQDIDRIGLFKRIKSAAVEIAE